MTVAASQPTGFQPAYERHDWSSAFRNVGVELSDVPLEPVRGTIPAELKGTLFRNGPGRLERGGQWVHHPFDGDGMISAFRFEGGQARLTNRFVRTEGWLAEEQAGRFVYRGVFGTQKPGGPLANAFDLRLKNIANTHVVQLGDQLLALWEAAEPHALDPRTLETRGLSRLEGLLKPGEAFSAHPRFDPGHHGEPRMVTFGVKAGPTSTIRLMEFASADQPDGVRAGDLVADSRHSFKGFAFLHDFAITPSWAVFLQNAVSFNPLPFVLGQKGAAQCLASKPGEAGQFWLVPRQPGHHAGARPLLLPAPVGHGRCGEADAQRHKPRHRHHPAAPVLWRGGAHRQRAPLRQLRRPRRLRGRPFRACGVRPTDAGRLGLCRPVCEQHCDQPRRPAPQRPPAARHVAAGAQPGHGIVAHGGEPRLLLGARGTGRRERSRGRLMRRRQNWNRGGGEASCPHAAPARTKVHHVVALSRSARLLLSRRAQPRTG